LPLLPIDPSEKLMASTGPPDVLIVDDSAAIRTILKQVLGQPDLLLGEIHEAADGIRAVEMLRVRRYGLILSDLNMPRMDGLQLLAWIRETEHLRNVPVIMITSEGTQAKVLEAVKLGATGYLRKPFTAKQVKEKVAAILHLQNPGAP
jgi:two-component system, chemotaxis family, chemotaxis protein CheY